MRAHVPDSRKVASWMTRGVNLERGRKERQRVGSGGRTRRHHAARRIQPGRLLKGNGRPSSQTQPCSPDGGCKGVEEVAQEEVGDVAACRQECLARDCHHHGSKLAAEGQRIVQ